MGDDLRDSFCSTLRRGDRPPFSLVVEMGQEGQRLKVHYLGHLDPPYILSFNKDGLKYQVDLKRSKDDKFPFRVRDDKYGVRKITKAEALQALKITEEYLSEHQPSGGFGQQLIHLRAKLVDCSEKIPTQSIKYNKKLALQK